MTIPEQADIVKRLRDWEDYEPAKMFGGEILKDTKEAADEIERLRSLVGVERAPPPLRAREEIAALRELYEWYDRDGSVGAAADVFEKHRALLAQRIEHEPFTPLRAREEIGPASCREADAMKTVKKEKPLEGRHQAFTAGK
jgi:hypothetical protein